MVFDVLELAGAELAQCSLGDRRRQLEHLLDHRHPCLQLVAHTADRNLAEDWLAVPSLEGVVAKRVDRPYLSGRARDWIKVKRQRTVDCVVIGVAGDIATPKLVLALRHNDDELHHLGRLEGVICHVERPRRPPFDPRQRVFAVTARKRSAAISEIRRWRSVRHRARC